MNILIICSGTAENFKFEIHQAFVYEQIEAIRKIYNIEYDAFFIKEKGIKGYFKSYFELKKRLGSQDFDIIHAHFGYSDFIAALQPDVPVVTTYHGSDINIAKMNIISSFASLMSSWRIFVSQDIYNKILIRPKKKVSIIPCGIDLDKFYPMNKEQARKSLGIRKDKKYILFASSFDNPIKNFKLAEAALSYLEVNFEIIELSNRRREEVNLLMNACDLLLMTSFSEGSPQVIKEALATNCPIVSTDVGDVKNIASEIEGCYISSFDASDVAEKIKFVLEFGKRTNGREKIKNFDNKIVAKKIYSIYQTVIAEKNRI